jgi:hypothetical protein
MGETGPLLFKLPQLLFQLFHRLGERTFARVLTRCAGFSVISQSVKEPTERELRRLGQKMIGPWKLRVYFPSAGT